MCHYLIFPWAMSPTWCIHPVGVLLAWEEEPPGPNVSEGSRPLRLSWWLRLAVVAQQRIKAMRLVLALGPRSSSHASWLVAPFVPLISPLGPVGIPQNWGWGLLRLSCPKPGSAAPQIWSQPSSPSRTSGLDRAKIESATWNFVRESLHLKGTLGGPER